MMKKTIKENPFRHRTITGDDLLDTADLMIAFFGDIVRQSPREGPFPRWNDSVDQLMEVARWLAHTHQLKNPSTGRPLTMAAIATRLCENLHRRKPRNIYAVARQSERSHRPDVVTYYTRLRVYGDVSLASFIDVVEPLSLPRLTSYRGVFDGGTDNG